MYINRVTLYGNITRDPELKALPSGIQVASIAMATNRSFKDKNGAKQDQVEYHNVVAFGKSAELIGQYMKKGQPLYVEGRLQTKSWDDQATGQKKYKTEIVVDSFQFGPKQSGGGSYAGSNDKASGSDENQSKEEISYPADDINLEEIPF